MWAWRACPWGLASWGGPAETTGRGDLARSSHLILQSQSWRFLCLESLQGKLHLLKGWPILQAGRGWGWGLGLGDGKRDRAAWSAANRILWGRGRRQPSDIRGFDALKKQKYSTGRGRGNGRDWCRGGCHGVCLSVETGAPSFNPLWFPLWHEFSRNCPTRWGFPWQ